MFHGLYNAYVSMQYPEKAMIVAWNIMWLAFPLIAKTIALQACDPEVRNFSRYFAVDAEWNVPGFSVWILRQIGASF